MSEITQLADKIRNAEAATNAAERSKVEEEAARKIENLEEEFKNTFPKFNEMLKAEGITWRGGLQDKRYFFKGSFIEFFYKDRSLKMDFNDRGSYRYEFVPYTTNGFLGQMTFGKWRAENFIVWLDEKLINKVIQ